MHADHADGVPHAGCNASGPAHLVLLACMPWLRDRMHRSRRVGLSPCMHTGHPMPCICAAARTLGPHAYYRAHPSPCPPHKHFQCTTHTHTHLHTPQDILWARADVVGALLQPGLLLPDPRLQDGDCRWARGRQPAVDLFTCKYIQRKAICINPHTRDPAGLFICSTVP